MCYAPWLSISTAIIELVLATWIILYLKKSKIRILIGIFIYFLAIYQFSEYLLCLTGDPRWATVGFIAYTFLPAIILHSAFVYLKKKTKAEYFYIIPAIFTLLAVGIENFTSNATCDAFFVSVSTLGVQPFMYWIYGAYYTLFLLATFFMMLYACCKKKDRKVRVMSVAYVTAFLVMVIPTGITILIFPALGFSFPSVLCQFALFAAIALAVGVYHDHDR